MVDRLRLGLAAPAVLAAAWALLQLPASAFSDRSTTPPSARVTVAVAGDIALLGPAPSSLFAGVRGPLRRADVAIGNLEGTLSTGGQSRCGKKSTSCFAFQSPPWSAALLRAAGFDDRPGQITVLRTHGVRVAIVGFAPYPWAQSLTDIPAAQSLVRRATGRADIVVAVLHAGAEGADRQHVPRGTEYYLGENRGNERRFAHALVGAGADLVVASGPHVLRGLQLFHNTLVAYPVGNFATTGNALSTGGVLGQCAILVVTLHAEGTLLSGKLLPVQMPGGSPRVVHGASDIVRRVNALSHADFGGSAVLVAGNDALGLG